ncbi:MAG TPA: TRAP transporter small permease subunit [Gammaproteobacteria bacterium]|nr:TRAP transporter small permease subunit [Gammaproteobacteria bacterium]
MPSLPFVLPHWLYWGGLLLFPLIAMYMVRRERLYGVRDWPSMPLTYVLWLTGGFVGFHRMYLRNIWGALFIPLLLGVLWGNAVSRDARLDMSSARNDVTIAQFNLDKAAEDGGADSQAAQEARQKLEEAKAEKNRAHNEAQRADLIAGGFAATIAAWLVVDMFLIPGMVRRRTGMAPPREVTEDSPTKSREGDEVIPPFPDGFWARFVWCIDRFNAFTGRFVAYWSVIAVFVYYYEVIARYVFNSPTNWAHESMFLMFGMQYLLSGAYALREGSHVRVDILYGMLPPRGRAITDVVTSFFFFVFCGALLWAGWTFAADSISVWEVSFTEWAIEYWPVKIAIPLGAFFILLQGIAHLIRDVHTAIGREI